MRYKFRIWDAESECFSYSTDELSNPSQDGEYYWCFEKGEIKVYVCTTEAPSDYHEPPYPSSEEIDSLIEQYTGQNDKNDVEIYEGSRIKLKMYDGIYEGEPKHVYEEFKVVWEQPKMRFGLMPLFEDENTCVCLTDSWAFDSSNDMEVIGNIHEEKP